MQSPSSELPPAPCNSGNHRPGVGGRTRNSGPETPAESVWSHAQVPPATPHRPCGPLLPASMTTGYLVCWDPCSQAILAGVWGRDFMNTLLLPSLCAGASLVAKVVRTPFIGPEKQSCHPCLPGSSNASTLLVSFCCLHTLRTEISCCIEDFSCRRETCLTQVKQSCPLTPTPLNRAPPCSSLPGQLATLAD